MHFKIGFVAKIKNEKSDFDEKGMTWILTFFRPVAKITCCAIRITFGKIWYVTWEYATTAHTFLSKYLFVVFFHIKVISVTFGHFCGQMLKKFVKALCKYIFLRLLCEFFDIFSWTGKKTRKTYLSGHWFHTAAAKRLGSTPLRLKKKMNEQIY